MNATNAAAGAILFILAVAFVFTVLVPLILSWIEGLLRLDKPRKR